MSINLELHEELGQDEAYFDEGPTQVRSFDARLLEELFVRLV